MKLFKLVKELLEEKEERRNSDKKLIWAVLYKLGYANNVSMLFTDFIQKGCPTPESITRCRRQIQRLHPELRATKSVQRERNYKANQKGTHVLREEVEYIGDVAHIKVIH